MARMHSQVPARKVVASTLASAVATILFWLAETRFQLVLPTAVQGAVIVLVTFAVGYLVPPSERDQIVSADPEV